MEKRHPSILLVGIGIVLWRSSIQSAKTRPGADCGSDHELLIAKFRLKLKKVGKTTRPLTTKKQRYIKQKSEEI